MSKVIYIDVDDTLVRTFGSKRIPITHMIEFVRALKEAGMELYCWSAGGRDYAKSIAEEFGIADCFVAFMTKPQLMIDDTLFNDWHMYEMHPNSCRGTTVEELLTMFSFKE